MTYNFAQFVIDVNQDRLDKHAVRDGINDLTYGELTINIKKVAQGLIQSSILPGQTVTICLDDSIDWPVIFLGCIYAGVVPLCVSPVLGAELLSNIVDFAESKLVITDDNIVSDCPIVTRQSIISYEPTDLPAFNGHPDKPSHMSVTSGSSGMPKITVVRHQTLFDVVNWSPVEYIKVNSKTVMMCLAKMSWNFGLQNSLTTILGIGATAIVVPGLPNPSKIFAYANRFRPTSIVSGTSIAKKMLGPASNKFTFPDSIQEWHVAGEPLTDIVYNQFVDKFNIRLSDSIGQTETVCGYAQSDPNDPTQVGTLGKVAPGCDVKLINENGDRCQLGEVGEIYAKIPTVAFYYLKNYAKTKETFVGEWVKTGDCGHFDKNNNLVYDGRVDDIFKINGLIVSPVEVESAILKYPAVTDAVTVGITNNRGAKELHAFIIPSDGFDLSQLNNFLSKQLFPHQIPRTIHIVQEFSKTVTNKNDRRRISDLLTKEKISNVTTL